MAIRLVSKWLLVLGLTFGFGLSDFSQSVRYAPCSLNPQLGAAVTTTAVGDFVVASMSPSTSITGDSGGDGFTNDGIQTNSGQADSHLTSTSAAISTYQPSFVLSPAGEMCSVTAAFKK